MARGPYPPSLVVAGPLKNYFFTASLNSAEFLWHTVCYIICDSENFYLHLNGHCFVLHILTDSDANVRLPAYFRVPMRFKPKYS